MTLLTREDITNLDEMSAKRELIKYADLLKTNVVIVKKLEERVKDLSGQVEFGKQEAFLTHEQIDEMKRRMFGTSSERRTDDGPGPLFDAAAPGPEYETVKRKKRTKFGRKAQPELPRVEVVHTIQADQVKQAGLKLWEGQFETSELISVIPTKIIVEVHKRQKYLATESRDPTLPPIVTAPGPLKTKEGSRYSLEFDIEVALAKYQWHLPLDRQVKMLACKGLKLNRRRFLVESTRWLGIWRRTSCRES